MNLWRISNHKTLDGGGGLVASARWHTRGHPVVYLAESPAGALVETLVHLELDLDHLPWHYQLLKVEAPDSLAVQAVESTALRSGWTNDELITRALGDKWLKSGETALLRVPSAIVPDSWNMLLNPMHPEANRVKVLWHRAHPWDKRLFR